MNETLQIGPAVERPAGPPYSHDGTKPPSLGSYKQNGVTERIEWVMARGRNAQIDSGYYRQVEEGQDVIRVELDLRAPTDEQLRSSSALSLLVDRYGLTDRSGEITDQRAGVDILTIDSSQAYKTPDENTGFTYVMCRGAVLRISHEVVEESDGNQVLREQISTLGLEFGADGGQRLVALTRRPEHAEIPDANFFPEAHKCSVAFESLYVIEALERGMQPNPHNCAHARSI